jgi:carotenoid 1,2-hydratase
MQIEDNAMRGRLHGDNVIYKLQLNEKLPSGDKIEAELEFRGPLLRTEILDHQQNKNHSWDLLQPRADVTGRIQYTSRTQPENIIYFEGQGYHDHNKGNEPLKNQFNDWYWGRFHFEHSSLIYYVMENNQQDAYAWIISKDGSTVLEMLDTVQLQDYARTIYGMRSARKLIFSNDHAQVLIQQTNMLDSGPFYQRFSSQAFIDGSSNQRMKKGRGITEYLSPPRIYNRWYWPLTNMRIRYKQETPHWVQRSKRLYRWTW